jgi:hypothetical protein
MGVEVDFQQAIYARLTDQIVGTGLPTTGVYDVAPQGSAFPYVTIGVADFQIFDAQDSFNFDVLTRIHTWSRSGSMLEVKQIQGQIYDALHDYDLLLPRYGEPLETDWRCYSLLRESSGVLRDEDQTFHGVCEFRALIQSA